MAITNQIPSEMVSGVVGEVAFDGPTRATGVIVDSGAVPAVIGHAATYKTNSVESIKAGGAGVFAGIIIHPKAYAVDSDTLEDGTQCEVLSMGEVYVKLASDGAVIGDPVYYVPATGELTAAADDGEAEPTANTAIPNCVVSRHNVSVATPTLAVIKLTN